MDMYKYKRGKDIIHINVRIKYNFIVKQKKNV